MSNSFEMSGPHIRQLDSIEKTMWNVVLALIPAIFMAVYLFGTYALYLVAATMITCMLVEIPFNKDLSGRQRFLGDGSAAVTGVILGLSLPPIAPWWVPIVGGAAAILVGKQLFGGLGNNIFNPALVGRAILSISWTVYMTQWVTPFDGVSTSTPLATPGADTPLWDLFVGTVPGSIGETSALALLIGAAYLYYKGYLDLRISIPYVVAAAVTAFVLGINPIYSILAGSLIIGAFFIATDMVSSPATRSGRIVYGIGCGVLTIAIRSFTGFPEGVTFAILLMNGFSHLFDTLFEGYIFGQIHMKKRRIMQVGVVLLSTLIFAAVAFGGFQLTEREFLQPQHRVFNQHMHEFFPHADGFNMLEELHRDRMLAEVRQGDRRVGFLAYTHRIGYDGKIENMVAINPDGEVIGSKIIDHNESATLGAQIEREDFLAQFVGLRYEDMNPSFGAGDFNLDTITNATLSSIAVAQTVETSLELVNRQLHGNRFDYFNLPTGRYRGSGTGWGGEMEAEVVVEDGFLMDIRVLKHNETPHKARSAFERLKSKIISAQSTDVDVISGSTLSSNGLLEAIDDALASRRLEIMETDFSQLEDGRYTGTAPGYIGDIEVEIEILDGEIVDIDVLRHRETTYLAEPALERLKNRVISEQSVDVEMVSGATLTSRGFLAAVSDAGTVEEPFAVPDEDGTYTGTAEGYQGDIVLDVVVENGEIVDIIVIDHAETDDIAEPAFEDLKERVLEQQSIDVDIVTGATFSSEGYLQAIENAFAEVTPEYEDGVYTATGQGYQSDIEIEVTISEGEISSIEVLSHGETAEIADPAFEDLEEAVIEAQSADVDTVSGATGTSEGYLEALAQILDEASPDEPDEIEEVEEELQDGEYIGTGEGYNDDIEVEITVEDGEIVAVEVLSHAETEDIAEPAFEDLEQAVIDSQSTDVDTVSGATGSSEGYLAAVDEALDKAGDVPEDPEEPEETELIYEDGTYVGLGEGYNDDIEIELTVEEGGITAIEVLSHEETEDIAEPAFEDLEQAVIDSQSTDVDTVSGATGSSEGYLAAVDEALAAAETTEDIEEEFPEIPEPEIELADGRFSGEAAGYNEEIVVEVVIENGLIVGIDVIEHDETPDIAEPAFEEMKDRVVAAQNTEVDTVTEATGSSQGFLRAVNVAITSSNEQAEKEPAAIYESGTYTASAEGYNDMIEVEITVDEQEITSIEVLSHEDTEDIAEPAFEDLEQSVIDSQSTDVDTISGATGSSEGYLAAVEAALKEAKIDEDVDDEPEAETFTGTGEGYNDDIEVQISVEDGDIVGIEVLSQGDTEDIAEPAFEDLEQAVIEAQSTDVDTVSGATASSEGYLAAVEAAMETAGLIEEEPEEEPAAIYKPGTYTASAEGYNDMIKVEITVDGQEITAIEVLSHEETDNIAESAFEDLEQAVIDSQSIDVDTISGATGTSEGYLAAVEVALEEAKIDEDINDELEEPLEEPEAETFTGTGEGYRGEIEIEITFADDEITAIEVLSHEDSEDIAEPAFSDLEEAIIEIQSTDVDTISGATGSSQGYLEAARDAIEKAGLEEKFISAPEDEDEIELFDGKYRGVGEGYSGDVEVEITVEDSTITSIEVLDHEDSEDIAEPAFQDLKQAVLEVQNSNVDTVSGATGSSEGYLEAVEEAVEKAGQHRDESDVYLEDGLFTGTGQGYSGAIELELTVEASEIRAIKVLSHEDSEDIAEPAFADLEQAIIEAQRSNVEAVSGATGSSRGYLEAVYEALSKSEVEIPEEEPEVSLVDGTFAGVGEGYSDDIEIELVITEGKISSIEVLKHEDSPDIAEPAFEDLTENIIRHQSSDVDVITGATGSSQGFLAAVQNAIEKAEN